MSRTNFTRILGVVIKIPIRQFTIDISNQAISLNFFGVKFHLNFNIFGDSYQGAKEFFTKQAFGLGKLINISVITVAFVGQLF